MILFTDGYLLSDEASERAPLSHARILWDAYPVTWSASSEADTFEAASVANPMTFRRWRSTSGNSWLKAEMHTGEAINAIGIAAHRLRGRSVVIESSEDNVTWTPEHSVAVATDGAILLLMQDTVRPYWRIVVSGGIAEIGVVFLGRTLDMQRSIYGGHSPGTLSRTTTKLQNRSESGQFLSQRVIRRGYSTSYAWQHLTADWYRAHFDPFAEYAGDGNPFFIAWKPDKFPREVLYGWTPDDIRPQNTGGRDFMSVSMNVNAFR